MHTTYIDLILCCCCFCCWQCQQAPDSAGPGSLWLWYVTRHTVSPSRGVAVERASDPLHCTALSVPALICEIMQSMLSASTPGRQNLLSGSNEALPAADSAFLIRHVSLIGVSPLQTTIKTYSGAEQSLIVALSHEIRCLDDAHPPQPHTFNGLGCWAGVILALQAAGPLWETYCV